MKLLLLLLGAAQGLRWPWATRRLATCEGRTFVPVTPDECPEELDITTCDDPDLGNGDLCEADGECGTSIFTNNCENYGHDDAASDRAGASSSARRSSAPSWRLSSRRRCKPKRIEAKFGGLFLGRRKLECQLSTQKPGCSEPWCRAGATPQSRRPHLTCSCSTT